MANGFKIADAFVEVTTDTTKVAAGVASLGTLVAGAVAPVVGGALAAVPALFGAIGIAGAAQSQVVKDSFTSMKDHVVSQVTQMSAPLVPVLTGVSNQVRSTFDQIAPALGQAISLTGPMIQSLTTGVTTFITNAMPGLVTSLGQAQPVVDALSAGVGGLGGAVGGFFEGLASGSGGAAAGLTGLFAIINPLLPIIGQLLGTLAQMAGPVLGALAPLITLLAQTFSTLLTTAIGPLIPPVMQLIQSLTAALVPILPTIVQLIGTVAGVFASLLTALSPVIGALATALQPVLVTLAGVFQQLAPVLGQIATQLGATLVTAIQSIAPILPPLVEAFGQLILALLPLIPPLLSLIQELFPPLAEILSGVVIPVLRDILVPVIRDILVPAFLFLIDVVKDILKTVLDVFKRIGEWVRDRVEDIKGFIERLKEIPGKIRDWFGQAKQWASDKLSELVDFVKNIPRRIMDALGNLGSLLTGSGKALIDGLWNGIKGAFGWVKDQVKGLMDSLRNLFPFSPAKEGPFSGKGYTTYSGQALAKDFAGGILAGVPGIQSAADAAMQAASGPFSGSSPSSSYGGTPLVASGTNSAGPVTIYVTIDANAIDEMRNVQDFFNEISQAARRGPQTLAGVRI